MLLKNFKNLTSDADWHAYKKQRNKCVSIGRKTYLNISLNYVIMVALQMKPFLTDKGTHHNQALLLRENDQILRDERKVAEVMNKYFVKIVKTVLGKKPRETISCQTNHETDQELDKIIKTFEDHPSVQSIRSNPAKIPNNFTEFKFKHASREDIIRII